MWEGLDAVDWASLEHNRGTAADVPALLRRCGGTDPAGAVSAAEDLTDLLFHQGGWICPAAPAALPFLIRLAASPHLPGRHAALDLVAVLAGEATEVADRFVAADWPRAWGAALPDIIALLDDPGPRIRRTAADVLRVCASPGRLVLPALLRRLRAEDDPATRLDLILATGRALAREPAGALATEASGLLRSLLAAPGEQTRLAAVHALAPHEPGLPARRLGHLLTAVRDPGVGIWRDTTSMECGARGMHQWTAALLDGPSPAFVLGLLADHPDEQQRIGALEQAGRLLGAWRSPAPALLPRIAERLADPAPEVRFRAAELLACLGPAAAAYADGVAALLGDTAARGERAPAAVADAALWALARTGDPRCLPDVLALLSGERPGFTAAALLDLGTDWHHPQLPPLPGLLERLGGYADVLAPAVADRLGPDTDDRLLRDLCRVLGAWGPAAGAAVPRLLSLLEDDRTWAPAAEALAGIGAAGAAGGDALRALARADGPAADLAARACLRVTGDPGPLLDALARAAAVDGGLPHTRLRRFADLGHRAAPWADRFRALTGAADPWTRVEAAHALWAATGDTGTAVPVLTSVLRELDEGPWLLVRLAAVRHLTRVGPAAGAAAGLLRDVPGRDRRVCRSGGLPGFLDDESFRAAVRALLAAAGPAA
ncbi:hypothetical protein [Streptomyces sp. RFCAC02]|uniref:hypothetical protein n=1 Tax=Streptomyces sp. RFCAC02 TaxID=2499143 RepID=UPI00102192E4|nr:hypothetical protein [Streptomyces sp. RFCAC02]